MPAVPSTSRPLPCAVCVSTEQLWVAQYNTVGCAAGSLATKLGVEAMLHQGKSRNDIFSKFGGLSVS